MANYTTKGWGEIPTKERSEEIPKFKNPLAKPFDAPKGILEFGADILTRIPALTWGAARAEDEFFRSLRKGIEPKLGEEFSKGYEALHYKPKTDTGQMLTKVEEKAWDLYDEYVIDPVFVEPLSGHPTLQNISKIIGYGTTLYLMPKLAKKAWGKIKSIKTLPAETAIEEPAAFHYKALNNLRDKLGVVEEGVEIKLPLKTKQPTPLEQFHTPRWIADRMPQLNKYISFGDKGRTTTDRLRQIVGNRLQYIDKKLAGGKRFFKGKQYKQNKAELTELLLEGDMLGKEFSKAELLRRGVNTNVIDAYTNTRTLYRRSLKAINKARQRVGKEPIQALEGYVPHYFHDFYVMSGGEVLGSARKFTDAVKMANQAKRAGGENIRIRAKEFRFGSDTEEIAMGATIGDLDYFRVRGNLQKAWDISTEEAESILQRVVKRRSRGRVFTNLMHRKGVQNWERDLDYATRHYMNMMSRYVGMDPAKRKMISHFEREFGRWDNQHTGLAKYVKDYIQDLNGVPTHIEDLFNSVIDKHYRYLGFLKRHIGERPATAIANMATNATAIGALGFYNTSAALVNASQAIMMFAKLGAQYSLLGVKDAAKVLINRGGKLVGVRKGSKEYGILKQAGVDLNIGLEAGAGYSKHSPTGKLFKTSMVFFQGIETSLRSSTVLGAYRKAKALGFNHKKAIEYAKQINNTVNFDYSIVDAPAILRRGGPLSQVMGQFKKFPINAIEFARELKGAENVRFWVPFTLLSGYYAFPGFEAVNNMVKGIWGHDLELEVKNHLIQWAGDDPKKRAAAKTIMYGAFANDKLGEIDVSHRVGMGDFIPADKWQIFGPFISRSVRTMQMAARGELAEALRAFATVPGNLAVQLKNEGELRSPWERNRLVTRLTEKGRLARLLGFRTIQEAVESDTARIFKYETRKLNQKKIEAIDRFIASKDSGDTDALVAAAKELGNLGISGTQIASEIKRKELTRSQRGFENLPKELKAKLSKVYEFGQQYSQKDKYPVKQWDK